MIFKLPDSVPTMKTSAQDWADYAEFQALKEGNIALLGLGKIARLISDEITMSGIEDESDFFINKVDEIASEIRRRIEITRGFYPFELANNDYNLKYIQDDSLTNWIYIFLLLSTRVNMTKDKIFEGIDGTTLFERLCAHVAQKFFGEFSSVEILGTSKKNIKGFRAKLSDIVRRIGEGGKIHEHPGFRPQDDKVDIVVWKGFHDKQSSQIIGFGQCKTGTSWQESITELSVQSFCKKWFSEQPVHDPLRLFFCAQYFPLEIWKPRAIDAGIVFDRFRLLNYLPSQLEIILINDIKTWCKAVKGKFIATNNVFMVK